MGEPAKLKSEVEAIKVTYAHCAGLDVHKRTVVICCLSVDASGKARQETRTYGTTTAELLSMSEWMATQAITHIAMESTGEYWKPVYNVLESSYEVSVVNSHHFKQVPGRKNRCQRCPMAC